MGFSVSQARLLSLTANLSDMELRAQKVNAEMLALSGQNEQASQTLLASLNANKLTVEDSDTGTFIDANVYNLTTYGAISEVSSKQRIITDTSGRVMISKEIEDAYLASKQHSDNFQTYLGWTDGNGESHVGLDSLGEYLEHNNFTKDSDGNYVYEGNYPDSCTTAADKEKYAEDLLNYCTNLYDGTEAFLQSQGFTSDPAVNYEDSELPRYDFAGDGSYEYNQDGINWYQSIFEQMDKNGYVVISDANMESTEWLQSQIEAGTICLNEWDPKAGSDSKGSWEEMSWTTGDSSLRTVANEEGRARAEAEYEASLAKTQRQEKAKQSELTEIESKHKAIETELEGVKKVIQGNTDRSFKTLQG